jgi:hypothetical protein
MLSNTSTNGGKYRQPLADEFMAKNEGTIRISIADARNGAFNVSYFSFDDTASYSLELNRFIP